MDPTVWSLPIDMGDTEKFWWDLFVKVRTDPLFKPTVYNNPIDDEWIENCLDGNYNDLDKMADHMNSYGMTAMDIAITLTRVPLLEALLQRDPSCLKAHHLRTLSYLYDEMPTDDIWVNSNPMAFNRLMDQYDGAIVEDWTDWGFNPVLDMWETIARYVDLYHLSKTVCSLPLMFLQDWNNVAMVDWFFKKYPQAIVDEYPGLAFAILDTLASEIADRD